MGSASGSVYSIDYDLNRMFWEQKLAEIARTGDGGTRPHCSMTRAQRGWNRHPGGTSSVE